MDLISVIIPIHNVENYLRKCLDSVISQSYPNLEIILVDDGSSDGSGSICDEYSLKDPRIQVIHQPQSGVSQARNNGLDHCHGDYITFVDSDDFIHPQLFSKLYEILDHRQDCISTCRFKQIYSDQEIEEVEFTSVPKEYSVDDFVSDLFSNDQWGTFMLVPSVWVKLYPRQLIGTIRFRNLSCEDLVFNQEIAFRINKVIAIDEKLYYYLIRKVSITGLWNETNRDYINKCKTFDVILDIIGKKNPKWRSKILHHALRTMVNIRFKTKKYLQKGTENYQYSNQVTHQLQKKYFWEFITDSNIPFSERMKWSTAMLCPLFYKAGIMYYDWSAKRHKGK